MKSNLRQNLLSLTILLAALSVLSGCSPKSPPAAPEIKNVRVVQAAVAPLEVSTEYAGKVKPSEEVTISSKIGGRVASVQADVSQKVTKGQVLFTLESDDIAAQYRQAQAALDTARTTLLRTSDSSLSQQLLQAETALKQAQLAYDDVKRLYDKTKTLYAEGAVSKQQLDDMETKYSTASVQLENAGENSRLLKERSGPQQTEVASTQVEQARAAVDLASSQLQNTVITSPISGVITAKNIHEGEIVSGSIPAFTVINTESLTLEVQVSDKMVKKLSGGQKLQVRIHAIENKAYEGTIDIINPSADPKTQLYTVKIKIHAAGAPINPGMLARVDLPLEKKEAALTVPNEAVVMENGLQYVYAVREDTVRKIPVTTGLSNEKVTEVTSGIQAGESLVTEGQNFLGDGEKVVTVK